MPKIFISYRRADSSAVSGRIYDRLVAAFGREQVFKDVDAIDLGEHYADRLRHEIYQCDVILVVIGPKWVHIRQNDGDRRIDDPSDPVRIEIETALQRKQQLLIIPLLVDNATMPDAEEFPESIRELHFINGQPVRNDPDFHRDMDTLIAKIQRKFGEEAPQKEETLSGTIVRPQTALTTAGGPPRWVLPLTGVIVAVVAFLAFGMAPGALLNPFTPTPTNTPTATASPTATATPTLSTAVAVARQALVARLGPGSNYPELLTLNPNDELDITGISEDGRWYQVFLPDGREGWIAASERLVNAQGPLSILPVALAPTETFTPTPTPTDTPTNTPTNTPTDTPTATPTDTPTATPTNTPTATPTATPTDTPTATPTNTPTDTPTATPTNTPTATNTPTPAIVSCPGALPSRLARGMSGRVSDEDPSPVNVRPGPSTDFDRIDRLFPNETFVVLNGPICDDGLAWFEIAYGGGALQGFIAEGTDAYFVEPIEDAPLATFGDTNRIRGECRRLVIDDDFRNDTSPNDWFVGRSSRSVVEFRDGAYQITLGTVPGASQATSWGSLRGYELGDATIEAEIRASQFTPDVAARTGLWIRYQGEEAFLAFMINSEGNFYVGVYQNRAYRDLVNWRRFAPIITENEAVNLLRIESVGALHRFYINDQLAAAVEDSTWATGRVAFMGSSDAPPATFSIDRIRICES